MIIVSSLLRAVSAAARPVARVTSRAVRTLRNRREVLALSGLDDRALKDIGLTRTDVHGALAAPIHQDPSAILRDLAGEGHGAAARMLTHGVRRPVVIQAVPKEA
jgi:uncharacterized protein YjiS (DUF1127 family)